MSGFINPIQYIHNTTYACSENKPHEHNAKAMQNIQHVQPPFWVVFWYYG